MKTHCALWEWTQPALSAAMLVAFLSGLGGCAMTEPLAHKQLQEDLHDPNVSIVVLRYEVTGDKPVKGLFGPIYPRWQFAVANEATGWNFRRLDAYNMIFHTRHDSLEPDSSNVQSGWVTFLVPSGTNYIAVLSNFKMSSDCLAIGIVDFADQPHFVVQVSQPQSVIYAGTLRRDAGCGTACNQGLAVIDESALAQAFAARYKQWFTIRTPMQTQLMSIPQTRTITINDADKIRQ